MKLSIVVPAFNEERLLGSTLESVSKAADGLDHELIVCDNNSTDRTAEIARAHGAKVVFEPLNQISRARNAGAAVASGDWLVFVDADSHPSAALFQEMVAAMASCIGGGSTVKLATSDRTARIAVGAWNFISRSARWAAGSFIFCRAEAFRRIGGFSTELYVAEEIDFSRRLKKLGRFVILTRHPLLTSGRKVELYSKAEHLNFLLKTIIHPRRTLRDPKEASLWYDGRR